MGIENKSNSLMKELDETGFRTYKHVLKNKDIYGRLYYGALTVGGAALTYYGVNYLRTDFGKDLMGGLDSMKNDVIGLEGTVQFFSAWIKGICSTGIGYTLTMFGGFQLLFYNFLKDDEE